MSKDNKRALWSAHLIARIAEGELQGVPQPITGISIDTRSIQAGDLFVALKDQRDGHDFVRQAFAAGASAALVAKAYSAGEGDGALIRVEDPLRALEDVGRIARFRTDAKVVAVTGSVGKTGTKEMLRSCLMRVGRTHASEASYNNHWGVPLTLARMPEATEYGVFEIGMSRAGEIAPLTRMVAPDIGIITTVEAVHLANFTSVEAIADAKAELLLGLQAGGVAVLNRDNRYFDRLAGRAADLGRRVVSFGGHDAADVRLVASEAVSAGGSDVQVAMRGRRLDFRIGAPGRHYVANALAVVAAIDALGAPLEVCVAALADVRPPAGRGARAEIPCRGGTVLLIDESYNANPSSMAAALANLGAIERVRARRRIAVLGDMRELGDRADELHRALAASVAAAGVDLVFACGPHMRALYDALPASVQGSHSETSSALVPAVVAALQPADAVMIKGSFGTNMAPLVRAVREIGGNTA